MFDPTALREVLCKLLLCGGRDFDVFVEHQRPRGGRALIYGEDMGHVRAFRLEGDDGVRGGLACQAADIQSSRACA